MNVVLLLSMADYSLERVIIRMLMNNDQVLLSRQNLLDTALI